MKSIHLLEASKEYASHGKATGLCDSTIRVRTTALRGLWGTAGDLPLRSIKPRHIDEMFALNRWQQATVNLRVSHLKQFFAWARARKYVPLDFDPMFGYRTRAVPEKPRTRIPRQEWPRLFSVCETTFESAVVASGLYLFLRASEQQGLRLEHIRLEEYELDVYRVKTKRWDTMPIPSELDPYLRSQLEWISAYGLVTPETHLFPFQTRVLDRTPDGRLIAGSGRYDFSRSFTHPHRVVQSVLRRAGYPTKWEGEHTLRRSGARAYFDSLSEDGYDRALRRVQSMLGHKQSGMTEVYLGLDVDRRERNTALRGKPMFATSTENVVSLGKVRDVSIRS